MMERNGHHQSVTGLCEWVCKAEERNSVFGDSPVLPLTGADASVAVRERKMSRLCLVIFLK